MDGEVDAIDEGVEVEVEAEVGMELFVLPR